MEDLQRFHWADYLVFVVIMVISLGTGVYFGFVKKQKRTAEEFLMAGRNMNVVPVSFSLCVSWMSAISFLGGPVECYTYGFIYLIMVIGYLLAIPPIAIWFAPYYNRLHIISAYEFLETSYNKTFRRLASLAMGLMNIVWLGIATYAPALALSQATAIPISLCIILIGGVCTFYTALGGMKAVLWADTLQFFIMLAGQLAIVGRGTILVGGPSELFRIAKEGGRINFMDSILVLNPLARATFWTYFVGGFFRIFVPYMSYQMLIQRYGTVRGPREASIMTWLNMPMYAALSTLIALNGLVLYAVYHDCDPYLSGRIERRDQMVPLAVIELLGFLPGLPGLFMATIFSASLSSMSSGMSGLSANLLEDFLHPMYKQWRGHDMSEKLSTFFAKTFALTFGIIITIVSFLPKALGSSIFAMTQLTVGSITGPVAGAFFIAILMPHIPTPPVVTGFLVALVVNVWLGIGALIVEPRGPWEELPLSVDGCPDPIQANATHENGTMNSVYYHDITSPIPLTNTSIAEGPPPFKFTDIYYWNPILYYVSGFIITIIVGICAHYIINLVAHLLGKPASRRKPPKSEANEQNGKQEHPFTAIPPDEKKNGVASAENTDTSKV